MNSNIINLLLAKFQISWSVKVFLRQIKRVLSISSIIILSFGGCKSCLTIYVEVFVSKVRQLTRVWCHIISICVVTLCTSNQIYCFINMKYNV